MPANKDGHGRPIPRRHRAKALVNLRRKEEDCPESSSKDEESNTQARRTCRRIPESLVKDVGKLADEIESVTKFCLEELELKQSKDSQKNKENVIEESDEDCESVIKFYLKELEDKQSENLYKHKANYTEQLAGELINLEKELKNILKHNIQAYVSGELAEELENVEKEHKNILINKMQANLAKNVADEMEKNIKNILKHKTQAAVAVAGILEKELLKEKNQVKVSGEVVETLEKKMKNFLKRKIQAIVIGELADNLEKVLGNFLKHNIQAKFSRELADDFKRLMKPCLEKLELQLSIDSNEMQAKTVELAPNLEKDLADDVKKVINFLGLQQSINA